MSYSSNISPQDIPNSTRARAASFASSASPTEELLACSPTYTEGCELYPKALRDTVNMRADGAVLGERDPKITKEAERRHAECIRRQEQMGEKDHKELLSLYPQAARRASGNSASERY
ncbi:hypothetical protein DL89DRAFT_297547 [Linderina pennispora]|uniref:Uncharacterized protein n=1 Tax=Linderina pennispora TaxID=61395 RepID=A0A1Y1VTE6_9FUNG|nr:uncharacterized protein DL89DRAFT_297547 [Linderina pennispora]ORX64285.1 hypothetical protein DL89DRAFT_297547 [Linderina pennispora]